MSGSFRYKLNRDFGLGQSHQLWLALIFFARAAACGGGSIPAFFLQGILELQSKGARLRPRPEAFLKLIRQATEQAFTGGKNPDTAILDDMALEYNRSGTRLVFRGMERLSCQMEMVLPHTHGDLKLYIQSDSEEELARLVRVGEGGHD